MTAHRRQPCYLLLSDGTKLKGSCKPFIGGGWDFWYRWKNIPLEERPDWKGMKPNSVVSILVKDISQLEFIGKGVLHGTK